MRADAPSSAPAAPYCAPPRSVAVVATSSGSTSKPSMPGSTAGNSRAATASTRHSRPMRPARLPGYNCSAGIDGRGASGCSANADQMTRATSGISGYVSPPDCSCGNAATVPSRRDTAVGTATADIVVRSSVGDRRSTRSPAPDHSPRSPLLSLQKVAEQRGLPGRLGPGYHQGPPCSGYRGSVKIETTVPTQVPADEHLPDQQAEGEYGTWIVGTCNQLDVVAPHHNEAPRHRVDEGSQFIVLPTGQ